MESEWKEMTLDEVCQIFDGPHATPKKTSEGPIFLGISSLANGRLDLTQSARLSEQDFKRWTRRVTPQAGDIVFSYETRLGEAAIIPPGLRCCLGRRMGLIRPDRNQIDPKFLLYYYLGPQFQQVIRSRTVHGSTVDRILLTEMGSFPILVPPLPEQRAIAHILGTLDDKIELNRRMNATLEAMARALFKSWFVDFLPVRAKQYACTQTGDPVWENIKRKEGNARAQGREGAEESAHPGAPSLPEHILALFPDGFEDSELGPIPRGWRVVSLPELFDVNPPRKLKKGEIAPYLEMKNMPENSARVLGWYDRPYTSGMRFKNDDTLVARITPCLENGKGAYVDFLEDSQIGWGSTEYIVLRSKEPLPPPYAYFFSRTEEFRSYAIANMTGSSGRQRVPVSALNSYLVIKPDVRITTVFGEIIAPFMQKLKKNDEESRTLAALRDTLLPKLISGELRVPDVEKILEESGL